MSNITIIDYGIGNLLSVKRAFTHIGANLSIAKTAEDIEKSNKLILPGVGAFSSCVNELKERELFDPIKKAANDGKMLLGICVGMQMLFENSEEFGNHEGLGLIDGSVKAIPFIDIEEKPHKIPHIGWSPLFCPENRTWADPMLSGVDLNSEVYFIHSYAAHPSEFDDRIADSKYGGHKISSIVKKGNVYGVQFHPEKSGSVGLKILDNFAKL